MNELQIFKNSEFGNIRTLIEPDGRVLFCGSDIAKALGYSNGPDALNRHCKYIVKRDIPHPQNPNKKIDMNFIPEGDIYRLAAKSELDGADKFEIWIFDEVLPTIRKHGAYLTPAKIEDILTSPDTIIALATQIKEEQAKNKLLEADKLVLEQRVSEYEPKVQYVDKILSSPGTLTIKQIAADYGLTAQALNHILHEEHIQYKVNGQWILYKEHLGLGYTKSDPVPITHSDGHSDYKLHTKWTQKGRYLIHGLLTKRGIMANMDKEAEQTKLEGMAS